MRYWWRNAGTGARLGHGNRLGIEDLTGKLPILLNVVDKLPVRGRTRLGLKKRTIYFSN